MPKAFIRFPHILVLAGLFLSALPSGFSQTSGVRQKALELRHPLVVLTISLQPGDEDFGLLRELRFGRGASVTSAYLTNGESGENDLGSSYPNDLAALRREEATQAVESIGCRAVFLNIPAAGSVEDSAGLWMMWTRDSVQIRIMRLVSSVRPHLTILFPERLLPEQSISWMELKEQLRLAILRLQQPKDIRELQRLAGLPVWEVQRVAVGKKVPRPMRKQPQEVRDSEGRYRSMSQQFHLFNPSYSVDFSEILHPASSKQIKSVYAGLPLPPSAVLRNLNKRIDILARGILNSKSLSNPRKQGYLQEITSIADSVDYLVGVRYSAFRGPDQKMLLLWKEGLQELKNELLGLSVSYTLADSVLTSLQVTTLAIDSVSGASPGSQQWFFFTPARQGWIINESMNYRLPLTPRTVFRIVSPGEILFNLPAQHEGLQRDGIYTPVDCFVVQSDSNRTNSFGFRLRLPFRFAPKFTVEVLTPVVRAVDGERVVVRTTNHSHDGVADRIGVSDSVVTSSFALFRLSVKESSQTDTLTLRWKSPAAEGYHLLHVEIAGIDVANFAARAFEVNVDQDRSVGIISALGASAADETLRRLGIRSERRHAGAVTSEWLSSRDVIVLDHRVYSRDSSIIRLANSLLTRAQAGGHIVVLSQDAAAWNATPLIKGLVLRQNTKLGPELEIHAGDAERLINTPNTMTEADWSGWLFSRGANEIIVPPSAKVLLSIGRSRIPAVVSQQVDSGRITFVNLNLPIQWLNIHDGAFRLLANLLAY